jgi:hypothetical protein
VPRSVRFPHVRPAVGADERSEALSFRKSLRESSTRIKSLPMFARTAATFVGLVLLAACAKTVDAVPSDAQPPPAPTSPVNPGESEESKARPKDASTQIVFGIDSEDFRSAGYHLTSYEIVVKVDGLVAAKESINPDSKAALPHETRVLAPVGKTSAAVEVEVSGVMNSAPVVSRRLTTRFVEGKAMLGYVFLETRCNTFALLGGGELGPTCSKAGETCVAGKCVSDGVELVDYRTDWSKNPPSPCGNGPTGQLEIAQGQDVLGPLPDGSTVSVECGPQGGHHLWMALRMKDLSQSGTKTTFSAVVTGQPTTVPATSYSYVWSPAAAGGGCELLGVRFQLDVGGGPIDAFLGKPLDIKVEAEDRSGRKAVATKHLNISTTRTGGPICR